MFGLLAGGDESCVKSRIHVLISERLFSPKTPGQRSVVGGPLCSSTAYCTDHNCYSVLAAWHYHPSFHDSHTWSLPSKPRRVAIHRDHAVASQYTSMYCIYSVCMKAWIMNELINDVSRTVFTCLYLVNWSLGTVDVHVVLVALI